MLQIVLKVISPFFVFVGVLHLGLGLNADVLLGANLSGDVLSDPVLDSQNRFYGIAFSAYGFLFYLCATDLVKYQAVLRTLLLVFFAAGCARIVSIMLHGLPSELVLLLLALELLLPPILIVWLARAISSQTSIR
jgi:hypothetical protein